MPGCPPDTARRSPNPGLSGGTWRAIVRGRALLAGKSLSAPVSYVIGVRSPLELLLNRQINARGAAMTAHISSRRTCCTLALALVGALSLGAFVGNACAKGSRQETAAAPRSPGIDMTTAFMLAGVLK
jgi:hypothetical protein